MNTEITLPKQSLCLTTTDRSEINKVLQSLVGKVKMDISIDFKRYPFLMWTEKLIINVSDILQNGQCQCATAAEFLAHFEKPSRIEINAAGNNKYVVTKENILCYSNDGLTLEWTMFNSELNQIVEAQKQLQ